MHHAPGTPFLLIGLKSDLRNDKEVIQKQDTIVSQEEATQMAEEVGAVKFLECSALTSENLKCVFDDAVRAALDKPKKKKKKCELF